MSKRRTFVRFNEQLAHGFRFLFLAAIERAEGCPGSGDESLLAELATSESLGSGEDACVEPGVAGVSMSMGSSLQLVSDAMLGNVEVVPL